MSYQNIAESLIALSGVADDVIVIHKAFVKWLGSKDCAQLLSQLLYWTPRSKRGGAIAKSDIDFQEELVLSRNALWKARNILKDMGILKTWVKKFNGTPMTHYKLDLDVLSEQWLQYCEGIVTEDEVH